MNFALAKPFDRVPAVNAFRRDWFAFPTGRLAIAIVALLGTASSNLRGGTFIEIDLGNAGTLHRRVEVPFSDLNGTGLAGQTLSLDFEFGNGEFVRLFSATNKTFACLVTLQSNVGDYAGFLNGTGYLLDDQSMPEQSPLELGRASSDDGSMSVGLFPLFGGLKKPLDFFGVHLDITLPVDASFNVVGGDFILNSSGSTLSDRFGVGPGVPRDIVPDSGETLLLLALGLSSFLVPARVRLVRH